LTSYSSYELANFRGISTTGSAPQIGNDLLVTFRTFLFSSIFFSTSATAKQLDGLSRSVIYRKQRGFTKDLLFEGFDDKEIVQSINKKPEISIYSN